MHFSIQWHWKNLKFGKYDYERKKKWNIDGNRYCNFGRRYYTNSSFILGITGSTTKIKKVQQQHLELVGSGLKPGGETKHQDGAQRLAEREANLHRRT